MIRRKAAWVVFFYIGLGLLAGHVSAQVQQQSVITLSWEDLIPEGERHQEPPVRTTPIDHDNDTPPQLKIGGVRHDLDGKMVKIPGFVIPLEGDDKTVTEFLLVPFLGACIHVPPPPPNQIIYVKFEHGAPIRQLWDIVYVVGQLKTETMNLDLGETGYVLYGQALDDYEAK
ncbi:DUF3299 domain-containing protein [Vibrio ruber]|uniref:Lipoprotein n=1 Tax=Vibrio ruber (strain DSM 16370 / JCM 11486 / BCRC 17186 / CECT 7878 / LMG 23124 / VR1) TaxID=1123498 RepID=A0A1R4LFA5_VIBR1|nr:DUF3299 domain-containing protein [Vibrio ruber]WNJ97879.1 DUF3299 domain-containing protein [Vibrio ruber]SJN55246.1 hypothetical protein VR7878_01147 [Vibrio ruber DSM 16370]